MSTERQEQGSQSHSGTEDQQAAPELKREFQRVTAVARIIRLVSYALGCLGIGYFAYLVIQSISVKPSAEYEAAIVIVMEHAFVSFFPLLIVLLIPWLVMFIVIVFAIIEPWLRRREKLWIQRQNGIRQFILDKQDPAHTLNHRPR